MGEGSQSKWRSESDVIQEYWLMACDAITKYISTAGGSGDGWSYNLLGVVQERLGLIAASVVSYSQACQLLHGSLHRNISMLNLARVHASRPGGAAVAVGLWSQCTISTYQT